MDRREWLDDNEEAFKIAFDYLQGQMWTALPAIVIDVNLEKQTISAQCSISGEYKNEAGEISPINMPVFQDVVLCFPRAGGYAITFPVQAGDEVLIVFASRCIDGWWQSGGENQIAPEFRMHDLSDGFALLAPTSQPKVLSGISTDSLRVTNEDQTKYVEISPDKVIVQSDADVEVNSDANVDINALSGDVNINAVNINLNGNVDFSNADTIDLTANVAIHITAPDIYISGTIHV